MNILYFGGQKSGKSTLAEAKALEISSSKPYYIATYDRSFDDKEMNTRVLKHQNQREENFTTIEEPLNLVSKIDKDNTYLVDCISMWILNNIDNSEEELIKQLEELETIDANIIFVLNDVNSGVIPFDKESRKFVDLTGIIGQRLASLCDEVYEVKLGLTNRLK